MRFIHLLMMDLKLGVFSCTYLKPLIKFGMKGLCINLKETHNLFKKWPLNLWWTRNKTTTKIGNITKAATSKSFLHFSYQNTQLLFSLTVVLYIFHETKINRWFLGVTQKYKMRVSFKKNGISDDLLNILSGFLRSRKQRFEWLNFWAWNNKILLFKISHIWITGLLLKTVVNRKLKEKDIDVSVKLFHLNKSMKK